MEDKKASAKQIEQLMKNKLHEKPWELSSKEAWVILSNYFQNKDEASPKVVEPKKFEISSQNASKCEFHLSPEEVSLRALELASKYEPLEKLFETAEKIEDWVHKGML